MDTALLICTIREARRKARVAATAEALCLLRDLKPAAPDRGPLAERGGVFWIALPRDAIDLAVDRLPRLGYTQAVDVLVDTAGARRPSGTNRVRWKQRDYRLMRVYAEDTQAARDLAPDRRTFVLESAAGEARPVRGYRGDSGPLSRRGLTTYDARLLVNLVMPTAGATFLDPFAGIGGLVLEAVASGLCVLSVDFDPKLRHGLAASGARHCVADASRLPFGGETIDAAATEPPYDEQAESVVVRALGEMARVLKLGRRLAMLCAAWHADNLRRAGNSLGLRPFLDSPIDRKGTDCTVLAWEKIGERPITNYQLPITNHQKSATKRRYLNDGSANNVGSAAAQRRRPAAVRERDSG